MRRKELFPGTVQEFIKMNGGGAGFEPGYRKEAVRVSQERTAERSHPNNQTGRRDLTDAEMRLARELVRGEEEPIIQEDTSKMVS